MECHLFGFTLRDHTVPGNHNPTAFGGQFGDPFLVFHARPIHFAQVTNLVLARKQRIQSLSQGGRKVFVEDDFHAAISERSNATASLTMATETSNSPAARFGEPWTRTAFASAAVGTP